MRRKIDRANPFYDVPRFAYGFEAIEDGTKLLDYGCFDGSFGAQLRDHKDVEYVGVDKNADVVPRDGARAPVTFIRDELPFENRTFDVATIFEVLEHVADQDAVVREIGRVLKPGGLLVVSVPRKHLFSWLDFANFKFVFPRVHRLLYTRRHSEAAYRYRYLDNPHGLVGDIEREKAWHQHFTVDEMRDLLGRNGFSIVDVDGAGMLSSLFDATSWIPPLGRLFSQRVRNWDSYTFDSRMLFCTARKN